MEVMLVGFGEYRLRSSKDEFRRDVLVNVSPEVAQYLETVVDPSRGLAFLVGEAAVKRAKLLSKAQPVAKVAEASLAPGPNDLRKEEVQTEIASDKTSVKRQAKAKTTRTIKVGGAKPVGEAEADSNAGTVKL